MPNWLSKICLNEVIISIEFSTMTTLTTYTSSKGINCVMNKKGVINYRMLKSKLEKQEIQLLIPFAAS